MSIIQFCRCGGVHRPKGSRSVTSKAGIYANKIYYFIVQAAYGLTAFDSVIHMVEEIPAPRKNAPRAIWLSVVIGAISGFLFMVVCLFCIQDLDTVINADLPFMQLVQDAIGLQGGAVLLALFIFNGLGQGISIFTTGSRLTWGFARDGELVIPQS